MSLGFTRHADVENYKNPILNKTHLPSTEGTAPFLSVTATRSVENFYIFELVQKTISHTFLICDNLVFLLLADFLENIVPQLSELESNLATRKRTDLRKTLSDGGSLVNNNACSQRKSKS